MSDRAAFFTAMAEEIARNGENGFGGAFVLVPPEGSDAKTALFLGNSCDISMFWGTLEALVRKELGMLGAAEAQANMFGNLR